MKRYIVLSSMPVQYMDEGEFDTFLKARNVTSFEVIDLTNPINHEQGLRIAQAFNKYNDFEFAYAFSEGKTQSDRTFDTLEQLDIL